MYKEPWVVPPYCCFYMLVYASQCDKLLYTSVQTSSSYIFGWYSQLFIETDFPYLVCTYDQPCHKKQTVKISDGSYLAGTDNHTSSLRMERSGWEKNGTHHALLDYIDCAVPLPRVSTVHPNVHCALPPRFWEDCYALIEQSNVYYSRPYCALPTYQTTETVNSN